MLSLQNGLTLAAPREVELTWLFEEVWVNRCYAPEEFLLGPNEAVVDIGANVGVFTLWAAAEYPGCRIIALEPSPESFTVLQQNVARNRLGQVELLRAACGGRTGTAVLYDRGPASMRTLLQRDLLGSTFRPAGSVRVTTLDEVFEAHAVGRCGLLKLDCEGAEYDILFNASDATIRRVARVAMEYHMGMDRRGPGQLADLLRSKGFVVTVHPPSSREDGYLYAARHT